tara:strand:+ start:688 stop:795 length:108 start_codon:yes stop_codon:yes gene_type:complete
MEGQGHVEEVVEEVARHQPASPGTPYSMTPPTTGT